MNGPRPAPPSAILLLRAGAGPVARWLARGVTPAVVAGMPGGWTLVTPAAASSLAAAPYHDAGDTLLARPVPFSHRPAIGVRLLDNRLLVCVVDRARRAPARWLAWEARRGLIRPAELPVAGVERLTRAAGESAELSVELLRSVLRPGRDSPVQVAAEMLDVLGLPGSPVLSGASALLDEPDAREVRPRPRRVAAFERAVGESHQARAEDVDIR